MLGNYKDRDNNNFEYISLQEATKFCNYSQEYLSLRARTGKLKSMKLGRNWVTTKEWLVEYAGKVNEYNESVNNNNNYKKEKAEKVVQDQIIHFPPENLPVFQYPKLKIGLGTLRPGFAAALVFVLITAGGVFGKESLLQTYNDIARGAETIVRNISTVSDDVFTATVNYKSALVSASGNLSDYGQWLKEGYSAADKNIEKKIGNTLLSLAPESFLRGYSSADQKVEQKIGRTLLSLNNVYSSADRKVERKIGEALLSLKASYSSADQKVEQKLVETGRSFKSETMRLARSVGEPFVKTYKSIVRAYKFITSPWKGIVIKEAPGEEGVVVKRVEVSRVVEPVREVTRETIQQITKVDDASLAEVRANMVYLEEEIGKRLYAPGGVISQTIYVTEPVSSPKIYQENNEIVLQTRGSGNIILSAATGLQLLGQQVMIESTNVLNPLIYLASKTRIGGDTAITGAASISGTLGVGGAATVAGNLTVNGSFSLLGSQTLSGNLIVNGGTASTFAGPVFITTSTVSQLKLAYDSSNYTNFGTNSAGDLTITPSGEDVTITGNLLVTGSPSYTGGASFLVPVTITTTSASQFLVRYDADNELNISVADDGAVLFLATGTDADLTLRTKNFNNALFIDDSTSGVGIGTTTLSGNLLTVGTTTPSLVVASNGYVGIGTTTPSARIVIDNKLFATGPELVWNGSFATSADGWNLYDCATYNAGTKNVTVNYTEVETYPGISFDFAVENGKTYLLAYTLSNVSNNVVDFWFSHIGIQPYSRLFGKGAHAIVFQSDFDGLETIYFESLNLNIGSTWTIDDVSIKESSETFPALKVAGYDGSTWLSLGGDLSGNTALGQNTLLYNTAGKNTAFGQNALSYNTSGYYNTANGAGSLQYNTAGFYNTANGADSLQYNTAGSYNTAIGSGALQNLNITTNGYGNNVAIGYLAGEGIVTGINNTIIGSNVTGLAAGLSNNIIIADGQGNIRINVDASGNMGIGTTTPRYKLDVWGDLAIGTSTNSATPLLYVDSGNGGQIGIGTTTLSTNFLTIGTTTPLFVIASNGYVGIGTSTPTEALTVVGNALISGDIITVAGDIMPHAPRTQNIGSAAYDWQNLYVDNIYANNINAASTTVSGTSAETFTINSDAVSDADSNLRFYRGSDTPHAILSWDSNNDRFDFNFPLYFSGTGNLKSLGDLTLSSEGTSNIILTPANNVGIATTSPRYKLDVWGDLAVGTSTGTNVPLLYVDSGTGYGGVGIGTTTLSGNLFTVGTTTPSLVVASNGYVGIGTSAPQQKLHLTNGTLLIDTPTSPTLVSSWDTSDNAESVYVSGEYAYVANGLVGLQIFDISNSSSTWVGSYNTNGYSEDVYVSGKYAYVADWSVGLNIIDISNPASPKLTSVYDTSGGALGVYVSGKYAYVADDSSGLQIIDISNPASPSLTGTYDTSGLATDVYVSGKYAYVADDSSGLKIIDISNPASPILVSSWDTSGAALGVYVSGKYAYVADGASGLQIFNISNGSSTWVGSYNTSGTAHGVYVSGKYAYVADDSSGLQVIDISNPASPSLTGNYNASGVDVALGVYISGKYAYIANGGSGLAIIDIKGADVHALTVGNISTNDITALENIDVGNNLYVRNGLNVGPGGIYSGGPVSIYSTTTPFIVMGGSTGFSGFGTTTPRYKLDVWGDMAIGTSTGTNVPALYVLSGNGGQVGIGTTTLSTNLLTVGTTTPALVVANNGYVGIASSTPSYNLSVGGDIYFGANNLRTGNLLLRQEDVNTLSIWDSTNANRKGLYVQELGFATQLTALSNAASLAAANSDDQYLMFKARDNTVGTVEVARLQGGTDPYFQATNLYSFRESGNVGIATSSPRYKLDVWGDMAIGTSTGVSAPMNYPLLFVDSGGTSNGVGIGTTTVTGVMLTVGTTTPSLVVANNGYVGIGTAAPGAALDVKGNIRFDNTARYIEFSDGAGTWDTNLYRSSANSLRTDDDFSIGTGGEIKNLNLTAFGAGIYFGGLGAYADSPLYGYGGGWYTVAAITSGVAAGDATFKIPRSGTIIPATDSTFDLGSTAKYFANTYTDSLYTTGNVGIATSSPRYKLDVWGDMAIGTSTGTNVPALYVDSGNGGQVGIGTTTLSTALLTVGTTTPSLVVANNGYVGIGTASPTSKLHVYTNNNATDASITAESDGANSDAVLNLDAYRYPSISFKIQGVLKSQFIEYGTRTSLFINGGNTEALSVAQTTGNVGIGTTGPSELLTVFSTTDPTFQIGTGSATSTISGLTTATSTIISGLSVGNNAALVVNQAATANSLYVAANGYVGIGTASPQGAIHEFVDGGAAYNYFLGDTYSALQVGSDYDSSSNAEDAWISLGTNFGGTGTNPAVSWYMGLDDAASNPPLQIGYRSTTGWGAPGDGDKLTITTTGYVGIGDTTPDFGLEIGASSTDGYFAISGGTGGSGNGDKFIVDENGYVGIGTAAPGAKLDVRGNIFLGAAGSSSGRETFQSSGTGETAPYIETNAGSDLSFEAPSGWMTYNVASGLGHLFRVNSDEKIRIDSSGNLGIGTTGPSELLTVFSTTDPTFQIGTGSATSTISGLTTATSTIISGLSVGNNAALVVNQAATANSLYVAANGYVGIGTATPGQTLDVNGVLRVQNRIQTSGGTVGNPAYHFTADTDTGMWNPGGDILSLVTNGTDRIYISGGNVGIGTTTPRYKLDVWGDMAVGTSTGQIPALLVDSGRGNGTGGIIAYSSTTIANYLSVGTSTTPTLFVDSGNGYVGIGTATPGTLLHLNAPETTAGAGIRLSVSTSPTYYWEVHRENLVTGDLRFDNSVDGIVTNRVTFQPTGNVGIGTTIPTSKLTVSGGDFAISSTGAATTTISGATTATSTIISGLTVGNNAALVVNQAATANSLYVATNGYVGIGTATPTKQLHIGGGGQTSLQNVAGAYINPNSTRAEIAIETSGGIESGILNFDNGNVYIGSWSSNPVVFRSSNSDRMTLTATGDFGIATTSPRYKLDVWGDMAIGTSTGVTAGMNYPLLYVNSGEGAGLNGVGIGTTTVTGAMLTVGTTTPALVVANNGYVGIGTSAPVNKLHIYDASDSAITLQRAGTSATAEWNYNGGTSYLGTLTSDGLALMTNNIARITISSAGDIGIATASPRYKLDVWGDFAVGTSTDTNTPALYVDSGTGGYVGIGTTTPYAALTINESSDLAFGIFNEKVLDNMEGSLYWTQVTGVTTSTESTIVKTGGQSLKITVGATEDVVLRKQFSTNQDLTNYERIGFWIYADRFATSSATTTQLLSFSYHDTGGTETTSTISFQQENRWQYQEITLTSTAADKDAINYIAFRTDFGGVGNINFYIDQIRAYNSTERSAEMFVGKDGALVLMGRGGVEIGRADGSSNLPGIKVDSAVVEFNQPVSVNVGGDVGMNNDLQFLSTGLSQITSEGPLRITAGDTNHAENLTLTTGGTGDVIVELNASSSAFMVMHAWAASTTVPFIINSESNSTTSAEMDKAGILFQVISDYSTDENTVFSIDASGNFYYDRGAYTPAADVAENYYVKDESIKAGDVVCLSDTSLTVEKCLSAYEPDLLGVISSQPALLMGNDMQSARPVALNGRVPVKISAENGPIVIGDSLTSASSTPGVAMKATGAGKILGYALEPFDGSSTSSDMIYAFINLQDRSAGDLSVFENSDGDIEVRTLTQNGLATLFKLDGTGALVVDKIKTNQLCVGSVCVTENEFMKVFGAGIGTTTPVASVCTNGANRPCSSDVGACRIGVEVCEGGQWGSCIGAVFPTEEIFDGVDNDCDGTTDEGLMSGGSTSDPLSQEVEPPDIVTSTDEILQSDSGQVATSTATTTEP